MVDERDGGAELEDLFEADVSVSRGRRGRPREGAERVTITCDPSDVDRVREDLADVAFEVTFDTRQ